MPLPASDYIPLPPPSRPTSGISAYAAKKPPSSNPKRDFLLRIGAFSVLELGFIALASIAGRNPIILSLPSSTTLTEAKGGFTVISITWHTLAVFTVKGILLQVFSAEWMEQYRVSGDLVPGETDIVSCITSGYIEQIKHFKSNKATFPFRIGFITSLLLVFLNALGPSTISVSSITLYRPSTTQVAVLTKTVDGNASQPWESERANLITRLEHLEGTEYGFSSVDGNILIPWPSLPDPTQEVVTYESDVITYNFSCSWEQPAVGETTGWDFLAANRMHWFPTAFIPGPFDLDIVPIVPHSDGSMKGPLSAFLFVGNNSTGSDRSDPDILDLGDIPSLFLRGDQITILTGRLPSALISILICDPQMHVVSATVTILDNLQLHAVPRSGPLTVGNIPQDAANVVFSESLVVAMSSTNINEGRVTSIMTLVFVENVLPNEGKNLLQILPLQKINQNMNNMLRSSAKAYLSGYRANGTSFIAPSFNMMETNATIAVQVLALTASKQFLISLLVVFCILVVLLSTLVVGVNELQTFDLENIVRTLKID